MPNFLSSILSLHSGRNRKTGSQGNYLFLSGPATQVKGGVRCETANSWVPLSPNSSYEDMDNELLTITEKVFEELRARERELGLRVLSWHLITNTFQNCPALYSDRTAEVEKYRQLPTARPSVWTSIFVNGSAEANASIVRKARGWMKEFISNGDVLEKLTFDLEEVSRGLVELPNDLAEDDVTKPCKGGEFKSRETTFLDVSILRYPDFEHPYIQVTRIRFLAWTHFKGTNVTPVNWGIDGVYNSLRYKLRKSILEGIVIKLRSKGGKEVEQKYFQGAHPPV